MTPTVHPARSSHPSRAAPFLLGLALALGALTLVGCGHGAHFFDFDGTLEVHNSAASFEAITGVEVSDPFGPSVFFPTFLFPGEEFLVDLEPGFYDVTVDWTDGSSDTWFDVDVDAGDVTTITALN